MDCHPMFKELVSKEPHKEGNVSVGNSILGTPRQATTPGRIGTPRQATAPGEEIHEKYGIPGTPGIQIRHEEVIVGAQMITESCDFENMEVKANAMHEPDGCDKACD